jgi:hypothetical protein
MLNLAYSNLILQMGGQLLLLVLGVMAVTFGITSEWPAANIKRMTSKTNTGAVNQKQ